jgi:hypothetical protein
MVVYVPQDTQEMEQHVKKRIVVLQKTVIQTQTVSMMSLLASSDVFVKMDIWVRLFNYNYYDVRITRKINNYFIKEFV